MKTIRCAAPLLAAGACLLLAACTATATDEDFASAVAHSRSVAEQLQSYEITATLAVAAGPTGEEAAQTMDVALTSAARWPDRLANRQEGPGFVVDLGTGPQDAWLFIGQLGACYVGSPAALTRDLETAQQFDLTEASVFNFYSGIAQFLLPEEPAATGAPVRESLTVDGRDVPCLVYTLAAEDGEPGEGEVLGGEGTAWYDPASGLVLKSRRTVRTVRGGSPLTQVITTTVTRFALNEAVAEDRFAFTPPTDVRVVDALDKLTNPNSMAGQPAPDITLKDFDGNELKVSDFRGKVLFLNFWATWCPPCRMEMPHIQTLHEELGSGGEVVFLGVSSEEPATINGFLDKNPYSFRMLMASPQDVAGAYATTSIPAIFVIDPDGVIRAHLVGAQTESQMRGALAKVGIGG